MPILNFALEAAVNNLSSNCITSGANRWAFINGTTNTSENPDIQFNEPGEYELVLFINNGCSVTSSFSRTITVREKPEVSISQLNTTCQFQDFFPLFHFLILLNLHFYL